MSIELKNVVKAASVAMALSVTPAAAQTAAPTNHAKPADSQVNKYGFIITNIPERFRSRYNIVNVREPNFLNQFFGAQHEITLAGQPAGVALYCMEKSGAVPTMRHAGDYPVVATNARGEVSISINGHLRGEFRQGGAVSEVSSMEFFFQGPHAYADGVVVDKDGVSNVAKLRLTDAGWITDNAGSEAIKAHARAAKDCVERILLHGTATAMKKPVIKEVAEPKDATPPTVVDANQVPVVIAPKAAEPTVIEMKPEPSTVITVEPLRPTTVTVDFGKPPVTEVSPTR